MQIFIFLRRVLNGFLDHWSPWRLRRYRDQRHWLYSSWTNTTARLDQLQQQYRELETALKRVEKAQQHLLAERNTLANMLTSICVAVRETGMLDTTPQNLTFPEAVVAMKKGARCCPVYGDGTSLWHDLEWLTCDADGHYIDEVGWGESLEAIEMMYAEYAWRIWTPPADE